MDGVVVGASAVTALLAAFPLRTRLPAAAVVAVLALAGAGLAWGGMMLRPAPSVGEVAAAVVVLAVLVPAHVRIVLGPFGRRGGGGEEPGPSERGGAEARR